jgi:catechol 2,3-dioxygenase-like lactoylglutathione lyase family enzyme
MSIRRAIPTVRSRDLEASRGFYQDFLGFELAMNEKGLRMFSSPDVPTTQIIAISEEQGDWDGATIRSDISIEVGDVDTVHAEAQRLGLKVVYPLTVESWGIKRFFVEDPDGTVINVTSHTSQLHRE